MLRRSARLAVSLHSETTCTSALNVKRSSSARLVNTVPKPARKKARIRDSQVEKPPCKDIFLRSFGPLIQGRLIKRYKRFLADVELEDGSVVTVHCPNTGPMSGLLDSPMAPVRLSTASNLKRKYANTLEMIQVAGEWVGIHSASANAAVLYALQEHLIPELGTYERIHAEVKYGSQQSRVDFVLERQNGTSVYVEVKSVTLVGHLEEDGRLQFGHGDLALFPDTVSLRAQRHLEELMEVVRSGHEAALVFLVQRGDGVSFSPCDELDPVYGKLLRQAVASGVKVLPIRTTLLPDLKDGQGGLRLDGPLPLRFL